MCRCARHVRQKVRKRLRAGLPFPTIVSEGTVGGGPGSHMYPWLAATVKSPRRGLQNCDSHYLASSSLSKR